MSSYSTVTTELYLYSSIIEFILTSFLRPTLICEIIFWSEGALLKHFHFVLLIMPEHFWLISPVCWRRWAETAAVFWDCSFVLWNQNLTWHFTHTTHTTQSLCWKRPQSQLRDTQEPASCLRLSIPNQTQSRTLTVYCSKDRYKHNKCPFF